MTEAELDAWLRVAAADVGVPQLTPAETRALLDLVRVVAHGVARPAGPLAAYLAGVAVGCGNEPQVVRNAIVARVPGSAS